MHKDCALTVPHNNPPDPPDGNAVTCQGIDYACSSMLRQEEYLQTFMLMIGFWHVKLVA